MKLITHTKSLFKFGLVGGSGVVVGFVSMYIFTDIIGIFYLISYIMSFCISVANNYIWNTIWTFKGSQGSFKGYCIYVSTSAFTLGITTGLMYLLTSIINIYHMISLIFVTICGLPINYMLSKKFVWRLKSV